MIWFAWLFLLSAFIKPRIAGFIFPLPAEDYFLQLDVAIHSQETDGLGWKTMVKFGKQNVVLHYLAKKKKRQQSR